MKMLVDAVKRKAEPEFGVVLKQRAGPTPGPRPLASVAVHGVEGGLPPCVEELTGGVGNQRSVAVQLGQQFVIRRFAAGLEQAPEYSEQRADQLRGANGQCAQVCCGSISGGLRKYSY